MKKLTFLFVMFSVFTAAGLAQSPPSFNYQAVVRDAAGDPLIAQDVGVEVKILKDGVTFVYCETQNASTNDKGLVTLKIGEGTLCSPNNPLSSVDWKTGAFAMEVKVDHNGNTVSAESPLLSVPFAMHAETVTDKDDADADPGNEIQVLSFSPSNGILELSPDGGQVNLSGISPWAKSGGNIHYTGKVGVKTSSPVFDLDVDGLIGVNSIYKHDWQNGMNNILISGGTNKDSFLRFRMGGSPAGKSGVVFSRFNTRHYFLHNSFDVLTIGHSTQDSDNPDVDVSTELARFSGLGTHRFEVSGTARANAWLTSSDRRFKKDFQPLESVLDKVGLLEGVYYHFKKEEFPERDFSDARQIGVIAQNVEQIFPELVQTDEEGYKSVDYAKFGPILVEAIKEQQEIIGQQQAEIAGLKAANDQVLARLEALEASGRGLAQRE